jgi:hypothetical protein
MIVRTEEKTMSLATFLAFLALLGAGVGAWVDLRAEVASAVTQVENNKDNDKTLLDELNQLEGKVDRIYQLLLEERE